MLTAHIADYREHYMIGLKFDETLMAYKWADGTTPAYWDYSNWGPDEPGTVLKYGLLQEFNKY